MDNIYILRGYSKYKEYLKLGYTTNITTRLNSYRQHNPTADVIFTCKVHNAKAFEQYFHKKYKDMVILGKEWYDENMLDVMHDELNMITKGKLHQNTTHTIATATKTYIEFTNIIHKLTGIGIKITYWLATNKITQTTNKMVLLKNDILAIANDIDSTVNSVQLNLKPLINEKVLIKLNSARDGIYWLNPLYFWKGNDNIRERELALLGNYDAF